MTTQEIASDLVTLCKEGKFNESGEKYWAEDVISVEFGGPEPVVKGKDAARKKGEWFMGSHDIHKVSVEGPWVNGEQFVVRFTMDMTVKESGQRMTMDEVGLYTVRDGKIAEERFFYGG
ncbi:MAG TPA: nuclear transport factor 2 family protein [Caulobacteraceae bacterium]|jgi:ketosteroid isomerase-like protein